MNLYKYLFRFKIESPIDRLTSMFRTPEDILKRRFIKKYLRKDAQFAIDQINTFAKRYYDFKYCWKEFKVNDQVWLRIGTTYRPKDRINKRKMPRCQKPYPIVRKISPLAYKLNLPIGNCIYPIIFIVYLTRYHTTDDLYNRIPPSSGLIEYRTESDSTSNDDEQDSKR